VAYRHFIVVGEESTRAAEASECAAEQGEFKQYHDILFERQGPENSGYLSEDRLISFGSQIGLDRTQFETCLTSRKYKKLVEDTSEAALSFGVGGTPTVFVNGRRVQNPLDAGQILGAIALAAREQSGE